MRAPSQDNPPTLARPAENYALRLRVSIRGLLPADHHEPIRSREGVARTLRDLADRVEEPGPPVVVVRRIHGPDYDYLRLDSCPFCGGAHTHGAGPPGSPVGYGDGHRASHCPDPAADPKKLGYFLAEAGPDEETPDNVDLDPWGDV